MIPEWDGLLLLDKPSGPTSHDLVDRVRAATGERRVGHAGTLDPLASGLLPMVLGRATRLVRYLPVSPKSYHGTLRLGLSTRTDDVAGEVLSRHTGDLPPLERLRSAAAALEGESLQHPPAVSARKVGGRRLYRLAQRGVAVEAEPRPVTVYRFALEPVPDDPAACSFEIDVSGGTYVRALVRDLGRTLGCGSIVTSLRRVAIGPMRPSPALRFEAAMPIDPERLRAELVPLEDMPLEAPRVTVGDESAATRFLAGSVVQLGEPAPEVGVCRVLDARGRLLGIGEVLERVLQPRVVLGRPAG